MAVTGKREWYLAVVILGREFKYQKITWDDGVIQNLISIEEQFWKENVEKNQLPSPDGTEVCDEMLSTYFPMAKKEQEVELVGFDEKLKRRAEVLALKERLEQEQKQIEQEIKLYMQDHERAYNDQYKVSWSNVESARIDTKRMKEEQPEVYQKFLKVGHSRRFQIKAR